MTCRATLNGQLLDPSFQIPVHYADVACDGTEPLLSDCPSAVASGSSHINDVYIVCLPGTEAYTG